MSKGLSIDFSPLVEQAARADAEARRDEGNRVANLDPPAAVHDLRNLTQRTPEAQADIAAARAPVADCTTYVDDNGFRHTVHAHTGDGRACSPRETQPPATRADPAVSGVPCSICGQGIESSELEIAAGRHLSCCAHSMHVEGCAGCAANPMCCARPMNPMPNGTIWCDTCGSSRVVKLAPGAIVLTGPEAERYRALRLAVRAAQDAARTVKDAGAALRDELQRFCTSAEVTEAKP